MILVSSAFEGLIPDNRRSANHDGGVVNLMSTLEVSPPKEGKAKIF